MKKIIIFVCKLLFLISMIGIAACEVLPFAVLILKMCGNTDLILSLWQIFIIWFFMSVFFTSALMLTWSIIAYLKEQ